MKNKNIKYRTSWHTCKVYDENGAIQTLTYKSTRYDRWRQVAYYMLYKIGFDRYINILRKECGMTELEANDIAYGRLLSRPAPHEDIDSDTCTDVCDQ